MAKQPRRKGPLVRGNEVDGEEEAGLYVNEEARRIYLLGMITDERAHQLLVALQEIDRQDGPITLVMNTHGGGVDAGYVIYDAIRHTRNAVICEGIGHIYSMGVLVMQAADYRMMYPEADLMVHDLNVEVTAHFDLSEVHSFSADLSKSNKRYQRLLSKRTGIPLKELAALCAAETYFTPAAAKKAGFIDAVFRADQKGMPGE